MLDKIYEPYKVLSAGDPVLKKVSKKIENPESEEIKILVARMHKTIEVLGGGIGLAAPQIGELVRLFIFNIPEENDKDQVLVPWTTVINPEIHAISEEKEEDWEGCFCFPNLMVKVPRYKHIKYTYQDLNGKKHEVEAKGLHAKAIQHELDHLDGILLIDRLESSASFTYNN